MASIWQLWRTALEEITRWVSKGSEASLRREQAIHSLLKGCVCWGAGHARLTGGFLVWYPPRRHTGREGLGAGLLPGLVRGTYGTLHLTESARIERRQLPARPQTQRKQKSWSGEGEQPQPTGHTQGSGANGLCYLHPPCSPQVPLASGKGEAWVKLRWPIHSSDRWGSPQDFPNCPISLTQMLDISWKILIF